VFHLLRRAVSKGVSLFQQMLREFRDALRAWWDVPPKPARPTVTFFEENAVGLKYKATLPAPGAADVAVRKLSITEAGAERVVDLAADALTAEFTVARDAAVSVKLADVDGSGNQSEWSEAAEFTALDTFAPPAPGPIGIESLGQDD
jgi:hypothetical protein